MRAFLEIVRLEWRACVRSKALGILTVLSIGWMWVAPHVFHTDGTAAGAREMCIRFSLGGVAALLAVVLLVMAAGSISRARATKRLPLTMVRPVRFVALVLGKILALSSMGALVLALAAIVEAVRQDPSRPCNSVYHPILPSPAEEAAAMYESYLTNPETPPAVKKAKKSVVMRLLTQRALDRYETVNTNGTAAWRFARPLMCDDTAPRAMRFRFSNLYDMRDDVRGTLSGSGCFGVVSNISQAVITVPLMRTEEWSDASTSEIRFTNHGKRAVMLRPRKDVELLVASDGFLANLVRVYLQLVGLLTLLVSFGVFLGAGLGRPVAVFVAVVVLALSEMSPSVVEYYPDDLETNRLDAIGLSLARFSATATHPIGSLGPLAALAADDRIEPREVMHTLVADFVVFPILFSLLAALILPRKQDEL